MVWVSGENFFKISVLKESMNVTDIQTDRHRMAVKAALVLALREKNCDCYILTCSYRSLA